MDIQRNINWKPVKFEFSNMFSYGENNKIDFTKVGGLMGLFAPNAAGKSSLFDAISFCLYDKCSRAFKASNILNNRKQDFDCHLHFQVNGIDYHIKRTAKTINKGKMERCIISATEQSERFKLAELAQEMQLSEFCKLPEIEQVIFACESEIRTNRIIDISNLKQVIAVLIGPEGGFSDAELDWWRSSPQTVCVHLPTAIMRTPTALSCAIGFTLGKLN